MVVVLVVVVVMEEEEEEVEEEEEEEEERVSHKLSYAAPRLRSLSQSSQPLPVSAAQGDEQLVSESPRRVLA
ncbi:hypothetical protein E2C01_073018 [Portunus trituberculatus]|uniref:Uncharacterized protein n=1 Tax=Portunus trituberculatus TaxID=210409 RepID=A0A5B7I1P0_PORTR|nr:hypothetical protein [Portunus trituberculatus]